MQDLVQKYEQTVSEEDQLIRSIQTCEEVITLLVDFIYAQNQDCQTEIIREAIEAIHQTESKLRGNLLRTRIEKTLFSVQMKKYIPPVLTS
ncbi:hypothetical protein [Brevibacillus parabrevis]|jgi:hypothetical protein|uniref:hypothetical protein n=1 Tax=Brevibacillus parabrevis TaxID=54914 RepID=UPI00249192D2|nr:hypothetical protein [Brevibacillus parabrevis]